MAPKTKKEAKVNESGKSRCVRAYPQLKSKDHVVKQIVETIDELIAGINNFFIDYIYNITNTSTNDEYIYDEFVNSYLQILIHVLYFR